MESKRATILLLLDNWRDRTLLTECIGQEYDVCAAEGDGGPLPDGCDLCVVDGPTLARMKAHIAEWQQMEETIYLPVLLLTTRQEVTLITASLWHVIDDVITTPVLKAEFHARVEVLLRCRRFSEEVLRQREVQACRERLHSAVERDRLMSAIEQAGEVIVITDRDGSIHYVNPAFEKLTGYTRAEALGCNPRILKSGEHPADFYAEMWRTLLDGCQWHGRLVNKAKDGAIFWRRQRSVPSTTSRGRSSTLSP
ncbi:PAS domain S-box protein [Geomonas sp. RF6]|uniref:PAS domain S-box protein n=1 Tax=Geomonas sp. RF6 TaxID=2897342 RepID=UPI001E3D91DE|nr:PAS domain S-box protein [Geomonas sp. RF6]UFS71389.1 PAS domain S-box protein [Geomonas sp. RF6]